MTEKEHDNKSLKIGILLVAGILLILLVGLPGLSGRNGKEESAEQGETTEPEKTGTEDLSAEKREETAPEPAGEVAPDGTQAVKILCGDYLGSGVIWSEKENEIVILSTAHLLMFGETAQILFADGSRGIAEVEYLSDRIDVGFAVLRTEESTGRYPEEWQQSIPDREDCPAPGSEVWLVASNEGAGQTIVSGTVDGQRFVPDMNNEMLVLSLTIGSGMSGSPVYDSEGYLLGIAVAGKEGETLAVPISQIADAYENDWNRQ